MIDHLVYATPDLPATTKKLADRLGVEPSAGGPHPGMGTRNFLLSLGGGSYFEIIGPDADQPEPGRPRPFLIDTLSAPRLVTWATAVPDLDAAMAAASAAGWDPGIVVPLSRPTPSGETLQWRVAMRMEHGDHAVVPFLIDWGNMPPDQHPSLTAAAGVRLHELRARHPDPAQVTKDLAAVGCELPCDVGDSPGIVAHLETPRGSVVVE